ncbi:MAG: hypothetical protein OHK0015_52850 [Chloroflexi bacterium OHK40]
MRLSLRSILSGVAAGALAAVLVFGPTPASAAPAPGTVPAVELAAPASQNRPIAGRVLMRALIRATADLSGLKPLEVREALIAGQSLAQVAAANGSSGEAVVDRVVGDARDLLDKAVERGRITREKADSALQRLTERATEMVNDAELGKGLPQGRP